MDEKHRLTTLESGVRIATEAMPSVRSVSLGFWVGTGSRYESDEQAGLSHLLEHLLFKGTEKYASLEIDQIFDGMGAELNAGTGKETTSVYARVIDEHLVDAFDVMADMVFRPTLRDMDSERQVILEEIAMYEDDPQEKVFDLLGEVTFGDDPLGRAIIGRAEVISQTPAEQIAAFHRERYRPDNVVISAAGAVDHDALVQLARERIGDLAPNGSPRRADHARGRPRRASAGASSARTPSSTTSAWAPPVCPGTTTGASPCACWTRSSAAPPRRGCFRRCARSAASPMPCIPSPRPTPTPARSASTSGTRGDNLVSALTVVGSELRRLREEPATPEELHRAKENLKGRVVLALESTGARMNRLGSEILAGTPLMPIDEVVERIEAVSLEDLAELAEELWAPERLSAAGIGPGAERFDEALAALGSDLVQAS